MYNLRYFPLLGRGIGGGHGGARTRSPRGDVVLRVGREGLGVHLVDHQALEAAHGSSEGEGGEGFGELAEGLVSLDKFNDVRVGWGSTEDAVGGDLVGWVLDIDIGHTDLVTCTEVSPLHVLETVGGCHGGWLGGSGSSRSWGGGRSRRFGRSACLLQEKVVDALLADVHLLSLRLRDPVGVRLADNDVSLVGGPWGVHLEDDAVDGVAKVILVADEHVLLEGLEGCLLEALGHGAGLLVLRQVRTRPLHALRHQREEIFLSS